MNLLLRKLYLEKKEFVTADMLKKYCLALKWDYDAAVKNLLSSGYLIRIFRGIFYLRTLEEKKLNQSRYNPWELVAKGLELKGVKQWYFGLHTALKFNNATHEYFTREYVVNDTIFRAKEMKVAGYIFKFIKFKPPLLPFGIKKKGFLKYSDLEKTILDFIYLKRYNGIPEKRIVGDLSEWSTNLSKKKIKNYLKYYPQSVQEVVKKLP